MILGLFTVSKSVVSTVINKPYRVCLTTANFLGHLNHEIRGLTREYFAELDHCI